MNLIFYRCETCGKIIAVLSGAEVPTVCCGKPMAKMETNKVDGVYEKHVPVFRLDGNTLHVDVGSVPHPMLEAHHISWIGLRTKNGFQFRELRWDDEPRACFTVPKGDRAEEILAYCNLHGLWSTQIEA